MKLSKLSAAILAAFSTSAVFAENTSLDQVVVSANNTEQSQQSVTANMTIITAEEIAEKQYKTLSDALKTVPGISVKSSGGAGKQTSVFMRGYGSEHILVLQNGIVLNDSTTIGGATNFENLQLADVERIEIIKGAQSGVWGANASAGVINIITKKNQKIALINLEVGSNNTRTLSTKLSSYDEQGDFSLNYLNTGTDGFSSIRAVDESHENFEDDSFSQTDVSLNMGVNLSKTHRIETYIKHSSAENEYDNTFAADPANDSASKNDFESTAKQLQYLYKSDRFNGRVFINKNEIQRIYSYGTYEGHTGELGGQLNYEYQTDNSISLLVNKKELDSASSFDSQTDYTNVGYALSHIHKIGKGLHLTESVRYDEYDAFKNATTGKLGIKQVFNDDLFLSANYGTAYKAPSLYQLSNALPMAELKPESMEGYDFTVGFYDIELTYFNNYSKNYIDYHPTKWAYYNHGDHKAEGVDFSYSKELNSINTDLTFNYSWLSAKNEKNEIKAYLPERQGNINLDFYGLANTHIGLETRYTGSAYSENDKQGVQVGNYFVTDLKADYQINKTLSVYTRVVNLFDDAYANNIVNSDYVYSSAGRQFFIGLRGQL